MKKEISSKAQTPLKFIKENIEPITKEIDSLFDKLYNSFESTKKLKLGFFEIPIESADYTKEDIENGELEHDLAEFENDPEVELIVDKEEDNYRVRVFSSPDGVHVIISSLNKAL